MSDDLKLAEHTVEVACALIDRLRAENERLRNKKSAAVCEWEVTSSGWYQGSCNENCKWLFRGYEECPSCGKSTRFAGGRGMSAKDVIASYRIGYPGAPGGLRLDRAHATAILAALDAAGYAVVPKEPTERMVERILGHGCGDGKPIPDLVSYAADRWQGIIAAAAGGEE